MKNIQVIDGAENCAFCIYEISDEGFALIFPGEGQDVEFIDDFIERLGEVKAGEILSQIWERRLEKPEIAGLHGTLFYEMENRKKYYPNKRETDLDGGAFGRGR